jgi:rhodanese-related sulfurtransferase
LTNLEINVAELSQWLKDKKSCDLLDVRENSERDICCLTDAKHVPLGDLLCSDCTLLPKDKPLVVFCHHGRRSLQAVLFLRDKGFNNAVSLKGGIHAWAEEIDPNMKKY